MNIEDNITCPITRQIFLQPVIANDGITYEKEALEKWLKKQKTSPVNRTITITNSFTSLAMKNIVSEYLEKYPEKKSEQYNYISPIILLIRYVTETQKKCDMNKLIEMVDKCEDFECITNLKNKLIHFICQYSTPQAIKYIIDKGVDLEYPDENGMRPIHLVCKHSTPEIIKYMIDRGVDLECVDIWGLKPIHYICKHSTPEIIKYVIDKKVNLESETLSKKRPVHYICKHSTPEIIKYMIEQCVDLECLDNKGLKPIHYICKFSTPDMMKYIVAKNVDVKHRDINRNTILHCIAYNETITLKETIQIIIDIMRHNPIIFEINDCKNSEGKTWLELLELDN